MRFKRYHDFIQTGKFGVVLSTVLFAGVGIYFIAGLLRGSIAAPEKLGDIAFLCCFFCGSPLLLIWISISHVRSMVKQCGGHIEDEVEMDRESIRLYSQNEGNKVLPWKDVFEVLEVSHGRLGYEIVVRGNSNEEISFWNFNAAWAFLYEKLRINIKRAPSDWRNRSSWRYK